MNLTIQQLSKATKLGIPTLYTYVSRYKLGKKIGNKRVFTQADVQKLLKSAGKSPLKKAPKTAVKKGTKRASKPESIQARKSNSVGLVQSPVASKPVKPSFWSRVFGGGVKNQKKVSLMDVKTTK